MLQYNSKLLCNGSADTRCRVMATLLLFNGSMDEVANHMVGIGYDNGGRNWG